MNRSKEQLKNQCGPVISFWQQLTGYVIKKVLKFKHINNQDHCQNNIPYYQLA